MYISERLVEMIERSADELARRWLEDVRKRPETPPITPSIPTSFDRVRSVYSHLGEVDLPGDLRRGDRILLHVSGRRRREEGFALSEVMWALVMTRRHIWYKVLSDGFLDTSLELNQALELNNRVVLFFDKAAYYLCKGYEKEE
jgi:hypothetical protein